MIFFKYREDIDIFIDQILRAYRNFGVGCLPLKEKCQSFDSHIEIILRNILVVKINQHKMFFIK